MKPMAVALEWGRREAGREPLVAAVLASAATGVLVATLAPGGDTASHLYRATLLERGVLAWDTHWYGGHSPFLPYSVLYYPLAVTVGHVPLLLGATAASAALFAAIALGEWGDLGRWPARTFALVLPAPVILGQYPYAVGLTALLATVWALQAGRRVVATAAAALTLGFSPLAFFFLCLVLAALALARPRAARRAVHLAVAVALLAGLQLLVLRVFSAGGSYVFPLPQFVAALGVAAGAAALALRRGLREPLAAFFLVWGLAVAAAFAVPDPVGLNVTRARWIVFPLVLAAALRARFRPRWLALPVVAAALAYNVVPYGQFVRGATVSRGHAAAFWQPALEFLDRHASAQFRVEVVPTAAHWEAYYLPRAGHPLARGWYRQLDARENPLLYEIDLTGPEYRKWLRARGVRYVLLPRIRLNQAGAASEARLLRSGRSGLSEVGRTSDWRIYALPAATPLLTGAGQAAVTELGHDTVAGWTTARGDYRLRVRHTPQWRVERGDVCVTPADDGAIALHVERPGPFRLAVAEHPVAVLTAPFASAGTRC
jgi:hypothetical protein